MGVITQEMNKKRQMETSAEGVVKFIKLTKFDEPKVTVWQGKKIESTHRASVCLEKDGESVWINLGEFKSNRDNITFKVGEEWKELKQGQLVLIDIKKVGEYQGKPTYQSSKSSITILEETAENSPKNYSNAQGNANVQGASPKSNAGSQSASNSIKQAGSAIKVYGDIKSISEGIAVVSDPKLNKDIQVVLGEHSTDAKLIVGGRLAAYVDSNGNIASGFKSYDAAKKQQSIDEKELGVRLGNALTVANLLSSNIEELSEIAKTVLPMIDDLRAEMKVAYPDMADYPLGARLGQCVIVAADKTRDVDSFITVAKTMFITMCGLENSYSSWYKVADKSINTNNELDETFNEKLAESFDDPLDFDSNSFDTPEDPFGGDFGDDIPFSPIALQYPELLNAM